MKKILEFTERYRKWIISAVVFVSLVMLYGFRFLRIESDISKWLKKDAPEVKSMRYISKRFGGEDVALVGVESDSIFTYNGFRLLCELEDSFEVIGKVASVTSLVNILDIKSTEGGIDIRNLIDRYDLPENPDSILRLKAYVLSKDIYRGRVISENGKVALFIINLTQDADKPLVAEKIREMASLVVSQYNLPVKLYFSGTPMLLKDINSSIFKDMIKLVPVVILIVVLILYSGMKNVYGVVLPLWVVVMASVWSMGLMGYFNVPLSVVSNVMPVLLIAIGSAYGIHILSRYARHVAMGIPEKDAVKISQYEVFVPVLLAAITTMTSFFSFVGAYVVSISHFGIFTGLGILFSVVLSLVFIPAILYEINYDVKSIKEGKKRSIWYEKIMENTYEFITKRSFFAVLITVTILAFGLTGFLKLKTRANLLYYFPRRSEIRRSAEFLRKNFKGDIPVYILVKGDLRNPGVLQEMIDFEKYMRTREDIGFPNSFADLIVSLNESSFGFRALPETKEQVENLAFMLEGRPILKQLVNSDYSEGIISANALMSAYEPVKRYFDNNLNRSLKLVDMDTVSLNSAIYRYLVSRTSWRIMQDAEYRGISVDTAFINRVLYNAVKNGYELNSYDLKELEDKIEKLFEEEDINVLKSKMTGLLPFITDSMDTLLLEGYVSLVIPSSVKEEDPEVVGDMVRQILSMRREFIRDKKVETVCNKIFSSFKIHTVKDSEFVKDIRGDIYTFFKRFVYVPSSLAGGRKDVKIKAVYSGLLPVQNKINENLMKSQIKSMVIALFVVLILVSLDIGSVLGGLVATIPIILVIAINFGIMGLLRINLDSGTMLVASIAIGIGIDYAIHFISHLKQEVEKGLSLEESIRRTIIEKGRAILINATTVGFGFLVLVFGNLIPVRNFGWLLFVTMIASAVLSLTFLPALILMLKGPFSKIFRSKEGGM